LASTLWVSFAAFLIASPSPGHAALDADAKKPYQLQVVLHVGANRIFTPLFQEQLERDIANRLKLAFGDLAKVEVTRAHPLLSDIHTKGLGPALLGWDGLSERTTHFVLLDYSAGSFQIQTSFHEGLTGQAGPTTTRLVSHDRADLARAIAQVVENSFCPVGSAVQAGKDVSLKLKGGELGVPLDRWVKKGHVFAVSRITDESGRKKADRLEWALLEALEAPAAGTCRCRYWHRYQEDALRESPGTLGYRATLLATATQPVKVQLLDDATLQPLDGVRVRVQTPGAGKPAELITNRDGLAVTREDFAQFALVQILTGETVRAQLPVELIPGRTPIARIKMQGDGESQAPFATRRDAWLRRIYENVRMSTERSRDLAAQLHQSLGAALESGKKSLPALEGEVKYLESERSELSQIAKSKKWSFDTREGDREIKELHKQAKELGEFVTRIEGVLDKAGGQKEGLGLIQLVERARLLEGEAEFEQAIRLYEHVVQASPGEKEVKAQLDKLKAAWTPVNAAHEKARAFLMRTWPALDVAGLGKNMEEAKTALAVCKAARDKLTPIKLVRANAAHTVNLTRELDALKRRPSEDNRNRAKALAQTGEALLRLHQDAAEWIGAK